MNPIADIYVFAFELQVLNTSLAGRSEMSNVLMKDINLSNSGQIKTVIV